MIMPSGRDAVLILDGQTNQALACVRALGSAGGRVLVTSTRRWPLARWSRYCEAACRLAAETPSALAEVRAWAAARGARVVLPLTERTALLCTADRAAWEDAGILVGCAPTDRLALAFDKARTIALAQSCGVRVPVTRAPESLAEAHEAAAAIGFPCIVKARCSSVRVGDVFVQAPDPAYVTDAASLERAVLGARLGSVWPLVQSIVPGRGKGIFALCDHGEPIAWFAHERLRDVRPTGAGSSLRRSVPLDERLRAPAERLLRAMRWHGPAMAEFRDDGVGEPWLMEVNGRFWGSLQLAVSAGVDFPGLWIALLRGERVTPVTSYATGVVVRWLWGDVKRLVSVLAGRPPGYRGPFPTVAESFAELFGAQTAGTRSEMWDRRDPWPAVGEWVQGLGEVASRRAVRRAVQRTVAARFAPRRVVAPVAAPTASNQG
jgi:predicted ATP-grasp superfamily ATP-dependent carboligase